MLLHVGSVAVAVRSSSHVVNALQRAFYTPHPDQDAIADWIIAAVASAVPDCVPVNPFGVGYTTDLTTRTLTLWSPDEQHLAITTRKCVREVFLDACEQRRHTMLHAAAIHRDGHVVVFAADKRGGKTTLALRAVLEHGWRLLANDPPPGHRQRRRPAPLPPARPGHTDDRVADHPRPCRRGHHPPTAAAPARRRRPLA
jgi:hypothetical protein